MRLDMSQQMKMDQRMVLAPRMIQSMEILQLPLLALQERIEQEMLANPVLELEEPAGEQAAQDVDQENSATNNNTTESEQSLSIKDDNSKKEDFQRLDNLGSDYDDYLERANVSPRRSSPGDRDPKMEAMQNTAAPGQSLNEFLHEQWIFVECEPVIKKTGTVIIDYIDETGYLSVELSSLAEHVRQPITPTQLEQALAMVQKLDPPGVGGRNLAECLLIQLQNTDADRSLEIELVENHLKDIEMNRFPAIARKIGRSINDIKHALQIISHLDPHPGMQVGNHNTTYIMPEVIVEYDEDNDNYHARLSDGSTPSLRINNLYGKMLKDNKLSRDTKEYLKNRVRSARWLIESIEQRKATLLRVVNHVLRNQRDFFDQGPQHLKPLPMVSVAAELGIHVGTVSRAVSGKYLQTPIGIYALRYFFSGGTETANGDSVSWDAVRAKLQGIIDNEDKSSPFNDDQLVQELQKHGLKLARRTIAKYRGLMNIPPARRRRIFE
ncbi:MAG: RNA polymerase factor sigma-54 [Sedimentisphaerales bacterium]|nr:RNA polymerase factor sigma-54 [Sedimentisphaerales bacterium]